MNNHVEGDSQDPAFQWGEVRSTKKKTRPKRTLSALVGGQQVGTVDVGLAEVNDEDDPVVRLDYIQVVQQHRRTSLSLAMLRTVTETYPGARLVGGPLSADDHPGPRFRQRAWDAGLSVHDPQCERDKECQCQQRIAKEVRRLSVRREWARWAHAWLDTAEQQGRRAEQLGDDGDAQGEASLCIIALHNAASGARLVLGKGADPVKEFEQRSALKDVRDMLSHYDAYIAGKGNLQWPGPEGTANYKAPWMVIMAGEPTRLIILTRTGNDGTQTSFSVELQSALIDVADLVAAALRDAGIRARSQVVERVLGRPVWLDGSDS